MPSTPLEHDYIGLVSNLSSDDAPLALNLKETELRLGLPGSVSPVREEGVGWSLGLPKSLVSGAKRGFSDTVDVYEKWVFPDTGALDVETEKGSTLVALNGMNGKTTDAAGAAAGQDKKIEVSIAPAPKAQVVGWPPIRSYRKNNMASNPLKNKEDTEGKKALAGLFVKVSMDCAPYLRKIDLKTYSSYKELSLALEKMFSCFTIGQYGSSGLPARDELGESCLIDLIHGSEYALAYEDKDGDWMLVGDVPWVMFMDSCRRLRIMKGSDAIGLAPRARDKCKN